MSVPITSNLSEINKDSSFQMRHNSFSTGLAKHKVKLFTNLFKICY